MLRLKGCPRCGGDVSENRDLYGSYEQCIQCGYMKDLSNSEQLLARLGIADFEGKDRGKKVA